MVERRTAHARELAASAAITIDVDTLGCYRAIHGLEASDHAGADVIYTKALERFLDVMHAIRARSTLFVIGRDLDERAHRALVSSAHARGHEIASHSHTHDYALSTLPAVDIDDDLARASAVIEAATGERPRGFRAPGYNLSEPLMDALERHGFVYDSSLFPTPAYYAARAVARSLHAMQGRKSHSLTGDVREFMGPRTPFRPARGARYRRARLGEAARQLIEIPMAVASPLRLPWLGTSLSLAPDVVGHTFTRAALTSRGPVVLELHAMDLLGNDDDVPGDLARLQPDLRVSSRDKVRRIGQTLRAIAHARPIVTLIEMAALVDD
jgi:hypothetical protein